MDHQELEGLAAGYTLGTLDEEEHARFQEHLWQCAQCSRAVGELRETAHALSLAAEEREPPAALRERVVSAIREERGQRAYHPSWGLGLWMRWRNALLHPVAAATLVVVLLLSIGALIGWNLQLQDTIQERTEASRARIDKTELAIAIMSRAEQWWDVQPSSAAPRVMGTLAYSQGHDAGCLVLWDLPSPDTDRYQVWLSRDGQSTRAGHIWEMDGGIWVIVRGDLESVDELVVTLDGGPGAGRAQGVVVARVPLQADR